MSTKRVHIQIKQLSKLKQEVEHVTLSIDIDKQQMSVADFLKAIVVQQIQSYYLTIAHCANNPQDFQMQQALSELIFTGKLCFDAVQSAQEINIEQEQYRVLQAFEDHLFLLFHQETELTDLAQEIELNPDDVFVFIALNFLKSTF